MNEVVSEQEFLEMLNGMNVGFDSTIGLKFMSAKPDCITAEVEVTPALLQPYGLVHGGVYSTIVESLASTGAAMSAAPYGKNIVGLDNNTTFLKAVRTGTLHATATPLAQGGTTHVWEVAIRDDADRLVASGRVRLLCVDAAHRVAGKELAVQGGGD